MHIKDIFKVSALPVFVASLCCLSPVILVSLGLASVSFGASLATTLYGTYKWAFRAVGLVLLAVSLVTYLRRQKGICTMDDAVRRKNEIINLVAITLVTGVVSYIFFLYVVVHYAGVLLSLWA